MAKIIKVQGQDVLVDSEDYPLLSRLTWRLKSGYVMTSFSIGRKTVCIAMHRLIMRPKNGQIIDHINGNRLDNTKKNLQSTSHAHNTHSSRLNKESTGGYKGVEKTKHNYYRARITHEGKKYGLGTYKTAELAAAAYDKAAVRFYGKHALTNKKLLKEKLKKLK